MSLLARRTALAALAAAFAPAPARAQAAGPAVEVWRNPGCGCCHAWALHLARAGLPIAAIHDVADLAAVSAAAGMPADLRGCHTARVGGYVIEGHVPASAVLRLLAERPDVVGLAVPGMPMGSPGMEIAGQPAEPFDVIAFRRDGGRTVFEAVRG
jgi:hypothetical protein